MSLLSADTNAPLFALRKHTRPITSLQFIHVPINFIQSPKSSTTNPKTKLQIETVQGTTDHLKNDTQSTEASSPLQSSSIVPSKNQLNSKNTILKPYLVSGDESGVIILWDLNTRRAIFQMQGHDSQVMTIKQLGIDYRNHESPTGSEIDSRLFGLVMTHGRDYSIKIWDFFDINDGFVEKSDRLIYEIPVNTLNFSNVDIWKNLLITPNTQNSNLFDVYDISFLSEVKQGGTSTLRRILQGVDILKNCIDQGFKFEEFTINNQMDGDVNRSDKFGIIMKLMWVDETMIFIGFESGHVVQAVLNYGNDSIKIIAVSKEHFPDPVLSLTLDKGNDVLISTSIKSKIVVHDITKHTQIPIKLNMNKISNIAIINKTYAITSWNGIINFYELIKPDNSTEKNIDLKYVSSYKKPRGMIQGDLNIIGSLNNEEDIKSKNKLLTKPNTIALTKKNTSISSTSKFNNRRDLKLITSDLLAVGYEDGTVMMYNKT